VPRFVPAPCPKLQGVEWLADASCGYLVVPEDRSRPTGRTIRLMVAKHPARSPEKRHDPVVCLAGVNELIAADFIRDRDILVVSQRGTTKTVAGLCRTVKIESQLASLLWRYLLEGIVHVDAM
jgi:hypothetical protein